MSRYQCINYLQLILCVFISACGGASQVQIETSVAESDNQNNRVDENLENDLGRSGVILVTGAAIKGPLAFANVSLYEVDTSVSENYDPSKPIAQGSSNAFANFVGIEVPDGAVGPFIFHVEAQNATDLNTQIPPVITQLFLVTTLDSLYKETPIYPSPLTTLAYYIAQYKLSSSGNRTAIAFYEYYLSAIRLVEKQFNLEISEYLDIINSPPILTDNTLGLITQRKVVAHRLAIEGLASVTHDYVNRIDSGFTNSGANVFLQRLAQDLYSDGKLNGADDQVDIGINYRNAFQLETNELTIPNTSYKLSAIDQLLTTEQEFTGSSIVLDPSSVISISGRLLKTQSNPHSDLIWTLSWSPSDDYVAGYYVFFGPAPNKTNQQVYNFVLDHLDNDPFNPAISFDVITELNLRNGDQGCFRIKAYNEAGVSDFSAPICADFVVI